MFVQNAVDEKPISIRFEQPAPDLQNTLTFKTGNLRRYPAPIADLPNFTGERHPVVQVMSSIFLPIKLMVSG